MKNQNWIALLIAVLIPSAALLIVRLRPEPREQERPRPVRDAPGPARADGFERVERNLLHLRDSLGLTPDQVKTILDTTHAGRRELAGIKLELDGLERELDEVLRRPEVPRELALTLLRRIHELRLRSDTLRLTIPLDIRAVLTPGQREKLRRLSPATDEHRPDDAMPPQRDDDRRPDDAMPPQRDDDRRPDDAMPPQRDDDRRPDDAMPPQRDGMRHPRGMRPPLEPDL